MEGDVQIKASVFAAYLEKRNLVIVPKSLVEQHLVNGVPLENYRSQILRRNLISLLEISRAQLWGPITKKAVMYIVRKEVPEADQVNCSGVIKIPRSIVRNIALQRGYAVG